MQLLPKARFADVIEVYNGFQDFGDRAGHHTDMIMYTLAMSPLSNLGSHPDISLSTAYSFTMLPPLSSRTRFCTWCAGCTDTPRAGLLPSSIYIIAQNMDDGDDAWSADPDDSFKTPKLDSNGTFSNFATPRQDTQVDEEPTPQQHRTTDGSEDIDGKADQEDAGIRSLARALPRLNLEAAIDADTATRNAQLHNGNGDESGHSDEESEPATARPVSTSRASSFSQMSPDLHILASMYRPEDPQLTVADSSGYFSNISLSTPTIDRFDHENSSIQWSESFQSQSKGKGKAKEAFGWSKRGRADQSDGGNSIASRPGQNRQHSSGRGFEHRKTASDASHMVMEPGSTVANNSRRSSWMANTSAFASTPSFPHEPETYQADIDIDNYRPRASSSSSSVADSVGTAGEAPDSDYEDARSKSHSRQGSRRPSVSEVPVITKRLSSFAPIPSLKANPSQTDLSSAAAENAQPQASAGESVSQKEGMNDTEKGGEGLSRASSSQSASSSASGSSTGGAQSAAASRTNSSGPITYSAPMAVANSQSFEQHRKENEKWLKKRKKAKPSPLDKVISKTRPHDLPPKERHEDVRVHYARCVHTKLTHVTVAEKASQGVRRNDASVQASCKKERSCARGKATSERDSRNASLTYLGERDFAELEERSSQGRASTSLVERYNAAEVQSAILAELHWKQPRPRQKWVLPVGRVCSISAVLTGLLIASYAKALALARSLQSSGKFPAEITTAIEADVK